jgi:hypothetical protein
MKKPRLEAWLFVYHSYPSVERPGFIEAKNTDEAPSDNVLYLRVW